MATTLNRAGVTPTDDDLSGTTGTAIDAAWADALMDAIDTLFTGVMSFSGFGAHSFSAGGTGVQSLGVRNTTAGTGNYTAFQIGNDASASAGEIDVFSSTFTSASSSIADSLLIYAERAGGLTSHAAHASGVIRMYSGGSTEVGRWDLTSSLQIGGTAARSGTAGTKRIDIFDGTAPTGTLANGCSIYSTTGELYTMDAAGNATLQTPHDHGPDWVFLSENLVTGKRVRIETEKLLKRLNERFGEPEWFQEGRP